MVLKTHFHGTLQSKRAVMPKDVMQALCLRVCSMHIVGEKDAIEMYGDYMNKLVSAASTIPHGALGSELMIE